MQCHDNFAKNKRKSRSPGIRNRLVVSLNDRIFSTEDIVKSLYLMKT